MAALFATILVGVPFTPAPAHAGTVTTGTGGQFVAASGRLVNNSALTSRTWKTIQIAGQVGLPSDGSVGSIVVNATVANSSGVGQLIGRPDSSTSSTLMMTYNGGGLGTTSGSATLAVGKGGSIQVEANTTSTLYLDIEGYYTSSAGGVAPGGFVSVPGTRIVDTRNGTGAPKATLAPGKSVTVQVGGKGGVPANASGVVANFLVVNESTASGFITPYTAGTARPGTSLNYASGVGVPTSDTAQVALSSSGQVTVFNASGAAGTIDIVIDVEGYFTSDGSGAAFTPVTGNIYDTRTGGNTAVPANTTRVIPVAGVSGIPFAGSGITAVAVQLTAINSATSGGSTTVWADGTTKPATTALNFTSDSIRGNTVIVPLGANGKIDLYSTASASTDYQITLEGWYAGPGAAIPSGQTSTQANVTLQGTSPGNGSWVTYKYANGLTGSFSPVPVADVTTPGTTTTPSSWPVQQNSSGTFDRYTWNVGSTLGGTSALVQVEACFGQSATDTSPVCSMPQNLTYAPSAFGGARDTSTVGPGSLSLLTGDFEVSSTDASASSALDSLSVGRTLTTLAPATATGAAGVFGPGWTADLSGPDAGDATLAVSDNATKGYELFTDTDGATDTYAATTSLSTYPITFTGIGDSDGDGTSVSKVSTSVITMTDSDGTVTTWTKTGTVWTVTSVAEVGSNSKSTYTTSASGATAGLVTRILGPVPAGVTCTTAVDTTSGCRSLILNYTAVAVGGASVERLTSVSSSLPQTTGASNITAIAAYDYTAGGLLQDAYDPSITPTLKTAYTYNSANRLVTVTPPGQSAWTLSYDSSNRVSTISRPDPSGSMATKTIVYGVPFTGSAAPVELGASTTATWGETADLPATATAIFDADHVPAGTTVASVAGSDWPYGSIDYLDVNGRQVNTAVYGAGAWQVSTTQFDSNGDDVWDLTAGNRAQVLTPTSATDSFVASQALSVSRANLLASTTTYNPLNLSEVTDTNGPTHPITLANGAVVDGQDHVGTVYDEGAPSDGTTYALPTTTTADVINSQSSAETVYPDAKITHLGYAAINTGDPTGWSLRQATSSTVQMGAAPSSADLTTTTRYNAAGQTIESRLPAGSAGGTAQDTVTSYFTATGSGSCVNAASAGLTCSTGPASQPSTGNPLPTKTFVYDADGNVLTQTETAGSTVRTTTKAYDAGERETSSSIVVTPTAAGGTPLPTVTTGYDQSTGLATTTSTGSGLTAQADTATYNSLGEVISYQDSTGNTSATSYDLDGRVVSSSDGKGTTNYTYDSSTEHRGLVTSENLNLTGMPSTFSATYDASGAMTTETYPNGLTATSTTDNAGAATALSYGMNGSTWMNFTETRGLASQIVAQSSPLSSQRYTFDNDDRLTTVQDSVSTGQATNCTTRSYGFDQDSNRTSLTTYGPGSGGACSTTAPASTVNSTYDQADRLTNTGYAYDTLGRTTLVPAVDASGIGQYATNTGDLSVSYYSNDLVRSEAQGTATITYGLDPEQNRISTIDNGASVTTNHYSDGTDSPAWSATSETAFTRSLDGIDGGFAVSVDQTGAATLELANMHGDIVATALDATTDTGIQTGSYSESTEYGAPRVAAAATTGYGWLGSKKRSGDSLGGLTLMGVRLYDSGSGRFLSTDPVKGGNANAYVYPNDPINLSDVSGQWSARTWSPGSGFRNYYFNVYSSSAYRFHSLGHRDDWLNLARREVNPRLKTWTSVMRHFVRQTLASPDSHRYVASNGRYVYVKRFTGYYKNGAPHPIWVKVVWVAQTHRLWTAYWSSNRLR